MLRIDAHHQMENDIFNLDTLTLDIIPQIENDIDPYDMVSLVFLLYDTPETALQRLCIFQQISKDMQGSEISLLHDWVQHVQGRATWKKEFLEALNTCQLYFVIRKIGANVSAVKEYFNNTKETFLNPTKVILYRLCENMKKDDLYKLKQTLKTYDIHGSIDYDYCEMVFLKLLCENFITISNPKSCVSTNIESLAKIIENFSGLQDFALQLRNIECQTNNIKGQSNIELGTAKSITQNKASEEIDRMFFTDFNDTFQNLNILKEQDFSDKSLKCDKVNAKDVYHIENPEEIGVCLIINQENFHPSKASINGKSNSKPLENRPGSTKDKESLIETMKALKFEVIAYDDLTHEAMIECIKNVIKYRFYKKHSMFMLCLLSHGTKGHIYGADSIKVSVEDIESLLDTEDAIHLRKKPKLMVLQACQLKEDDLPNAHLATDSPRSLYKYYIKKSDIIIFWATAANYVAYRDEKKGSIFIQLLCETLKMNYTTDHVNDLFTKVIRNVRKICEGLKCEQLPKVEHTLEKKIFLTVLK